MTSGEPNFNSKDLNKILPSYLLNEVETTKNEKDEENSILSDEINQVSK